MNNFDIIKTKLAGFVRKFYINEIIKGSILFLAFGLFYLLLILLLEYFLWMNTTARTWLFVAFISVELLLFARFILYPITKLFKLSKGINFKEASKIIGSHFTDVNDKLLNLLQLSEDGTSSDLLLASIEQKSEELSPVPFKKAINFTSNKKYLRYALLPILVFALASLINKKNWFSESYERVVNYNTAYEPPAPFQFYVVNEKLEALEGKDYVLKVRVAGEVLPESVTISFNDELYFMTKVNQESFEFNFEQPKSQIDFKLSANDVLSKDYILDIVKVPSILDFDMHLEYPSYIKKSNQILKSTGTATIPEGTKVTWKVKTKNTKKVNFLEGDSIENFGKNENDFAFSKNVYQSFSYQIATSNDKIKNYDELSFDINVIKDQYPELKIKDVVDSVDNRTMYFYGSASDDYGLTKLKLVYYDVKDIDNKMSKGIPIGATFFDDFAYTFPGDLKLKKGSNYEFYFEIYDNDILHGFKKTKSRIYGFSELTDSELEEKRLNKQGESISGMSKSLEKFEEQQKELQSLSKLQKEKKALDFNDKRKLQDFLKRQKEQEQMMKNFTEDLKENLDKIGEKKEEEPFKDALKEMMERNEERLKKREKLLEEINKLAEKIDKEELTEKLEKLGKENKKLNRNLDQLLELTKRYYVNEKFDKLADELEKLAQEQEKLADKKDEENTKEEQEKLNKEFEDFQKKMDELRKENEELKKPMELGDDKKGEEDVKKEQKKASEELEKQNKSEAKKKQKSAAQKMKQMSGAMQMKMEMSGEQQQEEDMEMLRQILDNLVDFSLEQEDLMTGFRSISINDPSYSMKLKRQSVLRENFIHVDDSLYALALRTPKISDMVTEKLTDIEFNIDKSLEKLAENMLIQGTANQQYAVTGANDLAYFLSRTLDQMQNSTMGGQGSSGDSEGFQLPDIIKKQGELNEKMQEGSQSQGQKGNQGKEGQQGDKKGKGEKSGKEGESGKQGQQGKQEGNGKGGKNGKEKGEGNGEESQGKDGEEGGYGQEKMSEKLFEIYKHQVQLRQALEEQLKGKLGKKGAGQARGLLNKMEDVERDLLENGFNQRTLSKMLNLKHELLKLEDATFEQGEDEKRESKTNNKIYSNTSGDIEKIKQYFNTTEILNRQVLPLQQNYKIKVQDYFKKND